MRIQRDACGHCDLAKLKKMNTNASLEVLELEHLGLEDISGLADLLTSHSTTLKRLSLRGNARICDAGIVALAKTVRYWSDCTTRQCGGPRDAARVFRVAESAGVEILGVDGSRRAEQRRPSGGGSTPGGSCQRRTGVEALVGQSCVTGGCRRRRSCTEGNNQRRQGCCHFCGKGNTRRRHDRGAELLL